MTVDVQFVQLRNTLEYADFAMLETVLLGDTIGRMNYYGHESGWSLTGGTLCSEAKGTTRSRLGRQAILLDAMLAVIATQVGEGQLTQRPAVGVVYRRGWSR